MSDYDDAPNLQDWRKGDKAEVLHLDRPSFWDPTFPTYMPISKGETYEVMGVDTFVDKKGYKHLLVLLFDETAEISAYDENRLRRIPNA